MLLVFILLCVMMLAFGLRLRNRDERPRVPTLQLSAVNERQLTTDDTLPPLLRRQNASFDPDLLLVSRQDARLGSDEGEEEPTRPPPLRRSDAQYFASLPSSSAESQIVALPRRVLHDARSTSDGGEEEPTRPPRLQRSNAQYFASLPSSSAESQIVALLPRRVLHGAPPEEDDTCGICLEEYQDGDIVACLPCGGLHKSHWHCINRWLQASKTCPSCRWGLPTDASCSEEVHALMAKGHAELRRISPSREHSRIDS